MYFIIFRVFQLTVITPHIGSASYETRTQMAVLAAQNLLCGLKEQEMPAQYKM